MSSTDISASDGTGSPVLSVAEGAVYCGIGRSLMAEKIAQGEIPSLKIASRRLIRRAALDAWLEKLEAAQVPA